jgi:hypothetical protein
MADLMYGGIGNKGLVQVDVQSLEVEILNCEDLRCYYPDKDNICMNTDSVTDEDYDKYCKNCNGCKDFIIAGSEETS